MRAAPREDTDMPLPPWADWARFIFRMAAGIWGLLLLTGLLILAVDWVFGSSIREAISPVGTATIRSAASVAVVSGVLYLAGAFWTGIREPKPDRGHPPDCPGC